MRQERCRCKETYDWSIGDHAHQTSRTTSKTTTLGLRRIQHRFPNCAQCVELCNGSLEPIDAFRMILPSTIGSSLRPEMTSHLGRADSGACINATVSQHQNGKAARGAEGSEEAQNTRCYCLTLLLTGLDTHRSAIAVKKKHVLHSTTCTSVTQA